jgi:Carbohydrate-binding module family 5/12/Pectate lyase superfamily protein
VGLPPRTGTESRAKGVAPAAPRSRTTGSRLANVIDFRAHLTSPTSQQTVFQAAIDSLLSRQRGGPLEGGMNLTPGTVWIPSGNYVINRPICLSDDSITLRGEDRLTTKLSCSFSGPAIIMGHRRRVSWKRTARSNEALSTYQWIPSLHGTTTFTNGSPKVTGTGSKFLTSFKPFIAYPILIKVTSSSTWYTVASVESDTSLTLTTAFAQTTASNANYSRGCDYLKRIPAAFAADHRIDAFGKLDTSLATATGQRYGITSKSATSGSPWADHFAVFPYANPCPGIGDAWTTINKLTLDICLEPTEGGALGSQFICGFGEPSVPRPWYLTAQDGVYLFTFLTQTGSRNINWAPRSFTFGNSLTGTGIKRISIQIDMTHNSDGSTDNSALCDIKAWIDGTSQTITRATGTNSTTGTTPFTAGQNLHFESTKPGAAFAFWAGSGGGAQWTDYGYPSLRGRFAIYGFRLSSDVRYTGTTQARIDAGALNDAYRYTGNDSTTIAYLQTLATVSPKVGDWDGRLIPMVGSVAMGSRTHYGLFMYEQAADSAQGHPANITVSDLTISAGAGASTGILVGPGLYPTIERVKVLNAGTDCWVGIGNSATSTYDIRIRDCSFGGWAFAWIAMHSSIVEIDNLFRAPVTKYAMWFDGCSVRCKNVRLADSNNTVNYVRITADSGYGFLYDFDGIDSDNEGAPLPTDAYIYAERHVGPGARLTIKNLTPGSIPYHVPMVKLVDRFAVPTSGFGVGPGWLHFEDSMSGRLTVETDGPGWEGVVENILPNLGSTGYTALRNHTGTDGATSLVSKQSLATLPTGGSWHENASLINIKNPDVGKPQEYLCAQSGYGTWSSAAAYILNDVVYSDGTIYRCTVKNTNSKPPSTNWVAIAAWNSGTAYTAGNLVTYNGKVWAATTSTTGRTPGLIPRDETWHQVGYNAQALFAPLNVLGTPTGG